MARGLELLAPAKNAAIAREAIIHGADAIYIGGPAHGARAAVSNSVVDIASVVDFAHQYSVRVYVTLNTIIYDNELAEVERIVHSLYNVGVDALIVQDMSLLRLDLPPIDLHASTQCDIRTIEKACFLADCGFSQLVLPRELSLDEISSYRQALPQDIRLEAFVHGALCVSYSGDCQASFAACGRSANRGRCAQMCRLPYSLIDGKGNVMVADKHLLSLRDLNRLADLGVMADAGISSFKIEGRLKDASYVKTITAAYRQALDKIISDNPDKYTRTSLGYSDITFNPDPTKAFNRGFTSYFLHRKQNSYRRDGESMTNFDTPKWVGEPVATVKYTRRGIITADITAALNNGDGLGYFSPQGIYSGFRANRIEGDHIFPATKIDIAPGTVLYRNNDTRREAMLAGKTATRTIDVDITLAGQHITDTETLVTLGITDAYGHMAQATSTVEHQKARSPQKEARRRTIAKLGDTILSLNTLSDNISEETFIPLSALSDLRRRATDLFVADIKATHKYLYRRVENLDARYIHTLTYHDNVANNLAERFYNDHGATVGQRALETPDSKSSSKAINEQDLRVMTTRYCLRREMGACLKTPSGNRLPSPLYITNPSGTYLLHFDCANCRMEIIKK